MVLSERPLTCYFLRLIAKATFPGDNYDEVSLFLYIFGNSDYLFISLRDCFSVYVEYIFMADGSRTNKLCPDYENETKIRRPTRQVSTWISQILCWSFTCRTTWLGTKLWQYTNGRGIFRLHRTRRSVEPAYWLEQIVFSFYFSSFLCRARLMLTKAA